jgi:hypothetical protein
LRNQYHSIIGGFFMPDVSLRLCPFPQFNWGINICHLISSIAQFNHSSTTGMALDIRNCRY